MTGKSTTKKHSETKGIDITPTTLRKLIKPKYDKPGTQVHMNLENEFVNLSKVMLNPAYYMRKYQCFHMFDLSDEQRNLIQNEMSTKELARIARLT